MFKQLKKQINWKITRKKRLWKNIVQQKIQSEIDVLTLINPDCPAIPQLVEYRNSVYTDDQTNREATAARLYFAEMFGSDFTRSNDDNINYALNYGYKIIASYISKCIASRGLLTQLGIHHVGESNPFNLTYDFIEPFRAIIDIWVKDHVTDTFNVSMRRSMVEILNYKVYVNGRWFRLCDCIEDIIDYYIAFLDERTENIPSLDLSQGIRESE